MNGYITSKFKLIPSLLIGAGILTIICAWYLSTKLPTPRPEVKLYKELRVGLSNFGQETLIPSSGAKDEFRYHGHIYDHIIGANSDGSSSIDKGILSNWKVAENYDSYILTVKPDIFWHDGTQLTAEDLIFSLKSYSLSTAACSSCGNVNDEILDARSTGDLEVEIDLVNDDHRFIFKIGPAQENVPLLPRHVSDQGSTEFSVIGSGSWKYLDRDKGRSIEFEPNLHYWNKENVPHYDGLKLIQMSDPNIRLSSLRTNEIHMAPIRLSDVDPIKSYGFNIDGPKYVIAATLRFFMSYDKTYLTSNEDFRKALIHSLDITSIAEKIYPEEAITLAYGSAMFDPLASGYDPDMIAYNYDPGLAQSLLTDMGYRKEPVHLISIPAYGLHEMSSFNELIAEHWREIGINVNVIPSEYGPVKSRYSSRPQKFQDLYPAPVFHGGHITRPGGIVNSIERYLTPSRNSLMAFPDLDYGENLLNEILEIHSETELESRLKRLNIDLFNRYWAMPTFWRHEVWALHSTISDWKPTDGTMSSLHFETVKPATLK